MNRHSTGKYRRNMILFLLCTVAAMAPASAFAQVTSSQTAPGSANEAHPEPGTNESLELSEIVVTATKRTENLQNVPISVTALDSQRISATGVSNTIDLNAAVPGMNAIAAVGFFQPFIRGVGSVTNGAGVETPVAIYMDGVYIAAAPAAMFSFGDVERIEVLKGPQGTLFGRNATGGLIQVITRDPTNDPELKLELGYGNYDTISAGGYAAGPIVDGVKAGLAVQYRSMGNGAGHNFTTGEDSYRLHYDFSARGKLVFDLGSRTTVKLAGDYYHKLDDFSAFRLATDIALAPPLTLADVPRRVWDSWAGDPNNSELEAWGGSIRVDHDFGMAKLMSLTAYRKTKLHYQTDSDTRSTKRSFFDSYLSDRTFTQELQLQSQDSSALKWVVGAYYFNDKSQLDPQYFYFLGNLLSTNRNHYPSESIAGYGEGTGEILPDTYLTLGARYTHETRKRRTPNNPLIQDKLSDNKITWRATLDHRFSPGLMIYATVSTGYKSGGFSGSSITSPSYQPETITAYEVGFKSEFADRRIRLNAAAFYYDYSDLQVKRQVPGGIILYNGAKARLKGFDGELTAIVSSNFDLVIGASYLDGSFVDFANGIGYAPVAGGGVTQVSNVDFSGNPTPSSPRFTGSVVADLHLPVSFGEFGFSANYYYNDGYYLGPEKLFFQKPYHMVNLTARLSTPDKKYGIRFWVRNLLNQEILSQKFASPPNVLEAYQPPRTFGATLSANF